MNKNTIIGIVLIFALMIGYTMMMSPSQEEIAAKKRAQDSIAAAQIAQKEAAEQANKVVATDTTETVAPIAPTLDSAVLKSQLYDTYGEFSSIAEGKDQEYILESDLLRLTLTSKGGRIGSVELKNYKTFSGKPLVLFNSDSSQFNVSFFAGVRPINTQELYFVPLVNNAVVSPEKAVRVSGNDSVTLAMRAYANAGDAAAQSNQYIEFLYTITGDNYLIDYKIDFVNMDGVIKSNTKNINIDWSARLLRQEKNFENEKNLSTIFFRHADEEVDNLSERKDDESTISTPVKWVSYNQQFFSSTFIADNFFEDVSLKKTVEPENESKYLQTMASTITMGYDLKTDQVYDFGFYFGPNKYNILRKYKLDLERQIPLGWGFFLMQWINRFAVIPVFNFLEGFDMNYGIIILVLTVLLKLVLFPIAYKTYISSAKMRLLKPEMDEISTKFPKQEDAMKKQQAVMALYKKAGVNPMAGCVPMLLQLPILIAMFRFFPASIELRQEAFLWANDLSSYDSVLDLPFTIPFYGDHVSLFTLLMTISTIIYTKLNNDMMSTGNQVPGMKTMMYMMPIMFLGFFNSYSAGLSYYYLLANLFTFAQMYAIRSFVDEKKLHAQIQENKKKPVKKSNFQKRLEDMAKQQQQKRR